MIIFFHQNEWKKKFLNSMTGGTKNEQKRFFSKKCLNYSRRESGHKLHFKLHRETVTALKIRIWIRGNLMRVFFRVSRAEQKTKKSIKAMEWTYLNKEIERKEAWILQHVASNRVVVSLKI